ncbi:PASTA domain-containing protein [Streptomyces sp. BI20]|uniref:PASTA domain-containing protein n=1 Tax=Streptomyces sp. BI20 TaxID=3403460 RepID=UPI003C72546D
MSAVALTVSGCLGDSGKVKAGDAKPVKSVAPAAPAPGGSSEAPAPVMPGLVGLTHDAAKEAVRALGTRPFTARRAGNDARPLPAAYGTWKVCEQTPEQGGRLAAGTAIEVRIVAPGVPCPRGGSGKGSGATATPRGLVKSTPTGGTSTGGSGGVKSTRTPTPKPTPKPTRTKPTGGSGGAGTSSGGTGASGGGGTSGGSGGGSTGGSGGSGGSGVTPGAFCSPAGATATGKNGKTYTCKGPTPNRWRR